MASLWAQIRGYWAYRRAMMLRFWGHKTLRREYYEASAAALTRVLALMPDHTDAYLARGLLYWRELQQAALAVEDFSSVLRLDPSCSEALFYRGMAYQALGDYAAAADDIRAALMQSPGAIWRENARSQLLAIESILAALPERLKDGRGRILPPGSPEDR